MPSDEQRLLDRLRLGDAAAFRELVEAHHRAVYRTALGFVRNAEDAEDVAQETFITAFESIDRFEGNAALATWLYRIAVTRSLDLLRRHKRKKRFARLTSLFTERGTLVVDPADTVHPGVQFEDAERSRILFAAVDRLNEAQRVAYTLRHIDRLSQKEVAEVMNLSVKAVESLLSRAAGKLRGMLREYYEDRA